MAVKPIFPLSVFLKHFLFAGVVALSLGISHSIILKQDGSVWATGFNSYGQLGDESKSDKRDFVKVVSSGANTVAAGSCHSAIMKHDGTVWATGENGNGQLGEGSNVGRTGFGRVAQIHGE